MAENRLAYTPTLVALCCVPTVHCLGGEGLGWWWVPARGRPVSSVLEGTQARLGR